MFESTVVEQISTSMNNIFAVAIYVMIGIVIAISVYQMVYGVIKKKKIPIAWILIGLSAPYSIPYLVKSITTSVAIRSDNIITFSGALLFFAGVAAGISVALNKAKRE